MIQSVEVHCRPTTSDATLREPVFVDCTIANQTELAQQLDLGANRVGAFVVSIEMPGGEVAHDLCCDCLGFSQSGEMEISPHGECVERLLLQRWHRLVEEGRYKVQIGLALSIGRFSAAPFGLTILPRDSVRLGAICQSLTTCAMSRGDAEQSTKAAEALAQITDPIAVPYLQRLLSNGLALQLQAITGLGRIDDDAARRLLRDLSRQRNQEVAAFARRALRGARGGEIMD